MEQLFAVKYSYLIPLLPLLGAVAAGFLGARWLKDRAHWAIWITVGGSAALSLALLTGMIRHVPAEVRERAHIESSGAIDAGESLSDSAQMAYAFRVSASKHVYTWLEAGKFKAEVGFFLDPLTAVMLCIVTGIGLLIAIYSKGYMAGERGYFRFFAYVGLFIFAMTVLVMADNFLLLYLGWEGVGLCSYLLIGHDYERPAAREAAKKAFLVNRVGDCGFALGIMLMYVTFGTVSYYGNPRNPVEYGVLIQAATNVSLSPWQQSAAQWIPFLLILGAIGKSAQFPLHVWLPDAMEGPTPVSALIHAATMVTAGVYMIVRCGTLFVGNGPATMTVAAVGVFTALFAATIAMRQFDLKRVFAYSTISQLGYMFAAAGVLAPVPAIFHLLTHAFFKALLFLSCGLVMHATMGELDLRKLSGLKRVLPWTNRLMLVGCMALAGVPFVSAGFFSKDQIIAAAWYQNKLFGLALLVAAFLTAYYTFRVYFRVFQGPTVLPHGAETHGQGDQQHGRREPAVMILPLVVLAVGAILAGYLNWPERQASLGRFLGQSPSLCLSHTLASRYGVDVPPVPFGVEEDPDKKVRDAMNVLHTNMMVASGLIAALGIYVAYLFHRKYRARSEELAMRFPSLNRMLERKYWVDEVYQGAIVEPLRRLGRAFNLADRFVIDGIVRAVSLTPQIGGFALKLTTQRGSLQGYAVLMLLGIAAILLIVLW